MHEQSETIQGRDKQWYNVYGGTPYPLPLQFGFEQRSYPTAEMAINRAQWRSQLGEQPSTTPPSYGFTNTYQPSPQGQAFGTLIDILNDPRNAWLGGGMTRGIRGFKPFMQEPGGFNLPIDAMRKALGSPKPNVSKMEVPSFAEALRADYLGSISGANRVAEALYSLPPAARDAVHLLPSKGEDAYLHDLLRRTHEGQLALKRFGFEPYRTN